MIINRIIGGIMTITEEQQKLLEQPLVRENVKTREGGRGMKLSYIEGHHAIREANTVFGFGGWSCDTIYCQKISETKNQKGNYKVGYEAKVRISAFGIYRDGIGYGSGIARDLFDAYEGAGKEAETDAMKRALKSFGDRFGLALYDKDQSNVVEELPPTDEELFDMADKICKVLNAAKTLEELTTLFKSNWAEANKIKSYNEDRFNEIIAVSSATKVRLVETESEAIIFSGQICDSLEKVSNLAKLGELWNKEKIYIDVVQMHHTDQYDSIIKAFSERKNLLTDAASDENK